MGKILFCHFLIAALAAGPSLASAATPSVITNPDWERLPGGQEFARYYPEAAQRANLAGRAAIRSEVTAEGGLDKCVVTEESPGGVGFGEAALKLSSLFKMRPQTKDGLPVRGGVVNIPIRFSIPGGAMDALSANLACYGKAAAFLERDPTADGARGAVLFFSMQILLVNHRDKGLPSAYEANLSRARTAAAANPKLDTEPTLKRCIDFAEAANTKAAPKP